MYKISPVKFREMGNFYSLRLEIHLKEEPNLTVGLGTMPATGGSAVVAEEMGNGDVKEARSNFTLIVAAGAVMGLLITFLVLLGYKYGATGCI